MAAKFSDLTVDAFTTPAPICVTSDTPVSDVQELFKEKKIRHSPVTNHNGVIVGIVSERDIHGVDGGVQVQKVMGSDPFVIHTGESLIKAAYSLSSLKIGSLIVVNPETGEVDGIFTTTDALNALIEVLRGDVLDDSLLSVSVKQN